MSELNPAVAGHFAVEGAVSGFGGSHGAQGPTAGELLRDAREAAGLHIAALAASLKVPVKKLEALEQDRFELLPDAVFARALASSVCRTLKVDPAEVLQRLPQSSAPKLGGASGPGINTPFRSASDGPGPSLWAQVSRPAVLAGLALLLGALVLIFLPAIKHDGAPGLQGAKGASAAGEAVQALTASVTTAGPSQVNAPALAAQQAEAPVAAASAVTAGQEASTVSAASTLPVAAPVAVVAPSPAPALVSPGAVAAVATPVSPAAAGAPTGGMVTFHAKSQSWVEVTDAKGVVVLRRTLAAGEVAGASGATPLAAVVGNADATQVQVRGQAFDLSALAKNNVARFEVK